MELNALFRVVNSPAPERDVAALRNACGLLPASYESFLAHTDGVECCIHDRDGDCLALWRAHEIVDLNEAYAISRYLAEFLAIGSDGGDDAIGFDRAVSSNPEEWPVVRIGFGNLERSDFVVLARGFQAWVDQGFILQPANA